jgi:hypothetical protein
MYKKTPKKIVKFQIVVVTIVVYKNCCAKKGLARQKRCLDQISVVHTVNLRPII